MCKTGAHRSLGMEQGSEIARPDRWPPHTVLGSVEPIQVYQRTNLGLRAQDGAHMRDLVAERRHQGVRRWPRAGCTGGARDGDIRGGVRNPSFHIVHIVCLYSL